MIAGNALPSWFILPPEGTVVEPAPPPRATALYLRTTPADGRGGEEEILARMRARAAELGLVVDREYLDLQTPRFHPELNRLSAAVDAGEIGVIVALNEAQLFAGTFTQAHFGARILEQGVRVVTVDTGWDTEDVVARTEFVTVVGFQRRIKHLQGVAAGKVGQAEHPSLPPRQPKAWVNPEEVLDLIHAGHSVYGIHKELAARGCHTSRLTIVQIANRLRGEGRIDTRRRAEGEGRLLAAGKRVRHTVRWPDTTDAELEEIVRRNESTEEASVRLAAAGKEIPGSVIGDRMRRAWKAGRISPRPVEYLISRGIISGAEGGVGSQKIVRGGREVWQRRRRRKAKSGWKAAAERREKAKTAAREAAMRAAISTGLSTGEV
ncbi:MAG TPA: hypothetical protein PKO05_00285 [Thermoanaerobaculia bacterium]|jgi:hypothetical protein|nr:hypothetical protein [Acidobacteriota bacterium]OQC41664.1 MAG: hypothetical protein BWX64_00734 [Acidobacteria bacterium ADurb.Bin051]HNU81852.1 hypothetical protein [Thermoanaerobaculia bacterium]HPC84836.1 hypothetical protein [Thermoanaerobaculaceae bacterium]HQN97721.1 hypothetical protein [Thermoanaerobaculales bacterium]